MSRGFRVYAMVVVLAALVWSACADSGAADLVLRGGKVATVDADFSIHQAIAVKDGRILFVGPDEGVEQLIGRGTHVIELDGKLVTPGMVDAHGHPFNLGNVDEPETFSVRGSMSWDEVVDRVAGSTHSTTAAARCMPRRKERGMPATLCPPQGLPVFSSWALCAA